MHTDVFSVHWCHANLTKDVAINSICNFTWTWSLPAKFVLTGPNISCCISCNITLTDKYSASTNRTDISAKPVLPLGYYSKRNIKCTAFFKQTIPTVLTAKRPKFDHSKSVSMLGKKYVTSSVSCFTSPELEANVDVRLLDSEIEQILSWMNDCTRTICLNVWIMCTAHG